MKRKLLSLLLMATMIVLLSVPFETQAAVKLSKAKAMMEVDSSLTLKISGTKSKVTWKSSNKAIASVSKKGVVTAKQEGSATITATIGTAKHTCAVTVVDSNKVESLAKFNGEVVSKKLKVTAEYTWETDYAKNIAIVVKNDSEYTVSPEINLILYDANGKAVGYKERNEYAFGSGSEMCFIFTIDEDYASYEYTLAASEEEYYSDVVSKLEIEHSNTDSKTILSITNNGTINAEFVEYTILYFDDDKVVGYGWGYCTDKDSEIKAGKTQFAEDRVYGFDFDSVKIYLSGRGDK